MKYDLTKPCGNCPFTRSTNFSFIPDRAEEIIYAAGGFACHKTTTEKGRDNDHKEAQACAGRLILLEREGKPDQMMRICERIGMYDHSKLDMKNEDVFDSIEEFMDVRSE